MTGEEEPSSRWMATPGYLLIAITFVLSRLLVLPFAQPTSDVGIYAVYAQEVETAAREGALVLRAARRRPRA